MNTPDAVIYSVFLVARAQRNSIKCAAFELANGLGGLIVSVFDCVLNLSMWMQDPNIERIFKWLWIFNARKFISIEFYHKIYSLPINLIVCLAADCLTLLFDDNFMFDLFEQAEIERDL